MTTEKRFDLTKRHIMPWVSKLGRCPELKEFTLLALEKTPDYFFEKPASSSGKYHPQVAQGEGGLLRHTLVALEYWEVLYRGFEAELRNELKRNVIFEMGIVAILFHDIIKYGKDGGLHTTNDHCKQGAIWLKEIYKQTEIRSELDEMFVDIFSAVAHHMGPWSVEGPPRTCFERLIFIADYMASTKIMDKWGGYKHE